MKRLLAATSLLALLSCAYAANDVNDVNERPETRIASVTTEEDIWIEGEGFVEATPGTDAGLPG